MQKREKGNRKHSVVTDESVWCIKKPRKIGNTAWSWQTKDREAADWETTCQSKRYFKEKNKKHSSEPPKYFINKEFEEEERKRKRKEEEGESQG